jgi:hypothetical protein
LCQEQEKRLLAQSEEIGNSKHQLSRQDEEFEEKVLKIQKDAERRIYEFEKELKEKVIIFC